MRYQDESIALVKKKRELSTLDDAIILGQVKKELIHEKKLREKIEKAKSFKELSRSSDFKEFIKKVRASFREVYGVFDLDEKAERRKLMKTPEKLLLLHKSSKERHGSYTRFYQDIFAVTGKPKRLLDLGCGFNPFSYQYLGCRPEYVAVDIPNENLELIREFFYEQKVNGDVLGLDLVKAHERIAELGTFDVAFLFKLLDSLETQKRNISRKLLDKIDATWLVVTFPTISISGKKRIKDERRAWFERLLERKGWAYRRLLIADEACYLVLKEPGRHAVGNFYEKQAKKLAERWEQYSMTHKIDDLRELCPRGKVLDVGSGSGRDAAALIEAGYEVTCADGSAKLIAEAKKRAPKAEFVTTPLDTLPFPDNAFDAVWSSATLVHDYPERARRMVAEWRRVLKPDGILFLSTKSGESGWSERDGTAVYFHRYTEAEMKALLDSFTIVSLKRTAHQPNKEGYNDKFLDLFARK